MIKCRYSAFIPGFSNVEPRLHAQGVDTLLIAGVATNMCCEPTARDALMLNYRVFMVFTPAAQRQTVNTLQHSATSTCLSVMYRRRAK